MFVGEQDLVTWVNRPGGGTLRMAPQADDESKVDRLKEAIRLLGLALESCEKLLAEAEKSIHRSGQDNDPE
jgi:hypothetical protein